MAQLEGRSGGGVRREGVCKCRDCRGGGNAVPKRTIIACGIVMLSSYRLTHSQTDVLTLLSPRGIILRSGDTQVLLQPHRVVMTTDQLVLRDASDRLQVLAHHNKHLITSTSFRATGDRALQFNTSIQTPLLTSLIDAEGELNHVRDLRIESLTRSTRLLGPKGVHIWSQNGSTVVQALRDVRIHSKSDRVCIPFTYRIWSHDHHSSGYTECSITHDERCDDDFSDKKRTNISWNHAAVHLFREWESVHGWT